MKKKQHPHVGLGVTVTGAPKCRDCWQNREKWQLDRKGRYTCKVCGRFIGYKKNTEGK